jgi:hypothetical protein
MLQIINKIKKYYKDLNTPPKVTLRKYQPFFTTIDNVVHEGIQYNYGIVDRLTYSKSLPRDIMIDIKHDDYIEDSAGTMYLLANVVSIEWKLLDELIVYDIFDIYKTFVNSDELEEAKNFNA